MRDGAAIRIGGEMLEPRIGLGRSSNAKRADAGTMSMKKRCLTSDVNGAVMMKDVAGWEVMKLQE